MTTSEEVKTYAQVDSSRIRIINAPILNPGTCAICGTSRTDDRKYIDFGLDVDFVGVMYFCTFCFHELIRALGCLLPEEWTQLQEELDAARQTIIDIQRDKAAVDHVVDTLRSTGLFSGIDFSAIQPTKAPNETGSGDVQDIVPAEPKPSRPGKNTKQSDPKQGPASLPEPGVDELVNFQL